MSPSLLPPHLHPYYSMRTSYHRRVRSNEWSNSIQRRRRDARISREYESALKAQSGHKNPIQAKGGVVIAPNDPYLVDFPKNRCVH